MSGFDGRVDGCPDADDNAAVQHVTYAPSGEVCHRAGTIYRGCCLAGRSRYLHPGDAPETSDGPDRVQIPCRGQLRLSLEAVAWTS
jgi:hypothetical protein